MSAEHVVSKYETGIVACVMSHDEELGNVTMPGM
jgi:hypothetical protein